MALALVAMIGCCASCKNNAAKPAKGPEKAADKAMAAVVKGDWDAYAKTFNLSESDQKMIAGLAEEKVSKEIESKGGIKDYKLADAELDEEGTKADVKVHITYKDGSEEDETLKFVKVDDEWKQNIDK